MQKIRLIYASDATEGLVYRDFATLMERASEANRLLGVTGMLCHGGGKFLQVLEGERTVVSALYHHIIVDPRHSNCTLMLVEDTETRDFSEWSMKVIDWDDGITRRSARGRSGTQLFEPYALSGPAALQFFRALAADERELLEG
ncbi:MAG: BLUF domain-containing protein [Gemmatimonadota bacterium]